MSVQFPQLTLQEQTDRYQSIAKNTLFPYSFEFNWVPSATTVTHSVAWFSGSYITLGFIADNNMAISALDVNVNLIFVNATTKYAGFFGMEISYSSVVNPNVLVPAGGAPAIPTAISDTGNIIYRSMQWANVATGTAGAGNATLTPLNIDDFRRYEPYNYLLKYQQIIYVHMLFDATTLGAGLSTINGSVIFHMLTTGLKV